MTDLLDGWYPPSTADSWDAVGTVCGDPAAPVRRVLLAVDPVRQVVDEALAWDADLLVVHHPLLLRAVHGVAATTPKGRVVHDLVTGGVALHVCHTNADSPAGGVSEALALALGLVDLRPIDPDPGAAMDKLVVFVPHEAAAAVSAAVTAAGAGAIGDYDGCTFTSTGTGSFRPLPGADPAVGEVGRVESVPETRLETVLPRHRRGPVVAAMRAAHPYEEPAFDLFELADLPGDGGRDPARARGSGRIGRVPEPVRLADFTRLVVAALPATPSALRVAGDPERLVERAAVCGGAGDFLLDPVRAAGVDVYVTSDLRHHPVSEFLEHARDEPATPAVVDVPHMAAEWTWLPRLARRLSAALAVDGPATRATVEVRVSTAVTDPWTAHLAMTGPTG
ncbi:Nif3-like dinuclear metal center hexameric protein [soil metagenome]